MKFDIMDLAVYENQDDLAKLDTNKDSYQDLFVAAEKDWIAAVLKGKTELISALTNILFSLTYEMNSDSIHTGKKLNPKSTVKPQCVWSNRLMNLKQRAEFSPGTVPTKRSAFKVSVMRYAAFFFLAVAALTLLFPPFTNLLRSNTAVVAEIIIILLGVASLFAGAIAVTILAVLVLILVEESLWWLIPALPTFWQNWLAPGFIIVVCLIAAAVFYVNYFNENVFLQKYLHFKKTLVPEQIERVRPYRKRLSQMIALCDEAQKHCLEYYLEHEAPEHPTDDDIATATLPIYALKKYYTHCLETYDNYMHWMDEL